MVGIKFGISALEVNFVLCLKVSRERDDELLNWWRLMSAMWDCDKEEKNVCVLVRKKKWRSENGNGNCVKRKIK